MKYFLSLIAFVLLISTADAQNTKQADSVYTQVDKSAEFSGAQKQYIKYLVKTVRYPAKAVETNTQGKVILQALIEKDGTISELKVKNSISSELDAEAIRVISKSPKWVPAQKDGKSVRSYYEIPVAFSLN
jgi:protein TonB